MSTPKQPATPAEAAVYAAYSRLAAAGATVRALHQLRLDEWEASFAAKQRALEEAAAQRRTASAAMVEQELAAAATAFASAVRRTAARWEATRALYPYSVQPFDAPSWTDYTPPMTAPPPTTLRVGQLLLPNMPPFLVPALVRLDQCGHLFFNPAGAPSEIGVRLLPALLLRAIVAAPPGTVRLSLIDPLGAGANLAGLLRLPAALRGEKVLSLAEEIEKQLDALFQHVELVIQTRLRGIYPSLVAYNDANPAQPVPYTFVGLLDFPAHISERAVGRILQLARTGPAAGVHLLIALNHEVPAPRAFDLAALTATGLVLDLIAPDRLRWRNAEQQLVMASPDEAPAPAAVGALLASIGAAYDERRLSLNVADLLVPPTKRWRGSTVAEIAATVGVTSAGDPFAIVLNRGFVFNGLVGGAIGSGKTVFLHTLLLQLALRYPPEELTLYLLDFKGSELAPYRVLPHVRALALRSEREFALAILRRLDEERRSRDAQFAAHGVNNLQSYRERTGAALARIVLIMDEFHALFNEDDAIAREAAQVLEGLARMGRSAGLHMLLCTQEPTVSGARLDRVYNQLGLRLAFRAREEVVSAILGRQKVAVGQLERPGDGFYRDENSRDEQIRVAFVPPEERERLRVAITTLEGQQVYPLPVVFNGDAPATLTDNPALRAALLTPPATSDTIQLWLGEPIDLKPTTVATLTRDRGGNLLVLGGSETEGYGVLLAAMLSIVVQCPPANIRLSICNLALPGGATAALFSAVAQRIPHASLIGDRRSSTQLLQELDQELTRRLNGESGTEITHYLLVAGLWNWRDLRSPDGYSVSETAKQLVRLADEGPELGIHLLVWSDSLAAFSKALKPAALAHFDHRFVLRLAEDDARAFGPGLNSAHRLADNRALYRNENAAAGGVEKCKPYGIPDAAALDTLLAQWAGSKAALPPGTPPSGLLET